MRQVFGEYQVDTIDIDIRVEKRNDYVHMIDVPSTSPDKGDEISNGS
jgi:multisubunit Na+/H+ antiporter MnhE subunit